MKRLAVAATACLCLGALVACGAGDEPEAPTDEPPDAEVTSEPEETQTLAVAEAPVLDPGGFPHGEHQRIECETCHTTVASHVSHAEVVCTDCHPVPESFGEMRPLSEQECMACHHTEEQEYRCSECHESAGLVGERDVTRDLHLAVWEAPAARTLRFDHVWHEESECTACHASTANAEPTTTCTTCHESHHEETATCAWCHIPADTTVHQEAAHTGCTGSGCHEPEAVASFGPTRAVCLTCHEDQADHEPGGDCAVCHAVGDWTIPTRIGGGQ